MSGRRVGPADAPTSLLRAVVAEAERSGEDELAGCVQSLIAPLAEAQAARAAAMAAILGPSEPTPVSEVLSEVEDHVADEMLQLLEDEDLSTVELPDLSGWSAGGLALMATTTVDVELYEGTVLTAPGDQGHDEEMAALERWRALHALMMETLAPWLVTGA